MRNLSQRVDARISTPCSSECYLLAGDLRERSLDYILHRATARLALPAAKSSAVVFKSERDSRHLIQLHHKGKIRVSLSVSIALIAGCSRMAG